MKEDHDSHPSYGPPNASATVTTRADIMAHIQARLNDQISNAALAKWAFDRFYAEEMGDEDFESGAEATIADVLDALMFGDDPDFMLDEAQLRDLLAQLREQ